MLAARAASPADSWRTSRACLRTAPIVGATTPLRTALVDDLVGHGNLGGVGVLRARADPHRDQPVPLVVLVAHGDDRPGHDEPGDRHVAALVPDLGLAGPVVIDAPDCELVSLAAGEGRQPAARVPGPSPIGGERAARPGH